MKRRSLVAGVVGAALIFLGINPARAAGVGLSFVAPHRLQPTRATMSPALVATVDREVASLPPANGDEAVALALRITSRSLRFGMGHQKRLHFDTKTRQAHCVEYAQLYAAVLNRVAQKIKLPLGTCVVRSDARVFGKPIDKPGWRDHDWVLVTQKGTDKRWFVDPSLADAGMGWDVRNNVRGWVRTQTGR